MATTSPPLVDGAAPTLALSSVTVEEPAQSARVAGLRYICNDRPGWGRRRSGKGVVYFDKRGDRISDPDQLKRIKTLVIHPLGRRYGSAPPPTVICWLRGATPKVASSIATIPTGAPFVTRPSLIG